MTLIRFETADDFDAIYEVVQSAFAKAGHADGNEQVLVERLRSSDSYVPTCALVAVEQDQIVGYIMLTKVKIGTFCSLALAPLAVSPEFQKRGIGANLIHAAFDAAIRCGNSSLIVVGDPHYYQRFGFLRADIFCIVPPFEIDPQYFMAVELMPDALRNVCGVVQYDPVFGI